MYYLYYPSRRRSCRQYKNPKMTQMSCVSFKRKDQQIPCIAILGLDAQKLGNQK